MSCKVKMASKVKKLAFKLKLESKIKLAEFTIKSFVTISLEFKVKLASTIISNGPLQFLSAPPLSRNRKIPRSIAVFCSREFPRKGRIFDLEFPWKSQRNRPGISMEESKKSTWNFHGRVKEIDLEFPWKSQRNRPGISMVIQNFDLRFPFLHILSD